MTEVALYAHVPFCSSKCHFCVWVAHVPTRQVVRSSGQYAEYVAAMLRQMDFYAELLQSRGILARSIYFGGGTPTVLSVSELRTLAEHLRSRFEASPDFRDVTVEASPESVDLEKLQGLRATGVDRLSIGMQSFDDARLRRLGRSHNGAAAVRAFRAARTAGFENINIDLMFGFPGESDEEWRTTLRCAADLCPDHFSLYLYRPVPRTVLVAQLGRAVAGEGALPLGEVAVARYHSAVEYLAGRGYTEYAFQLFERGGKVCAADLSSFELRTDYIGFGAGARSLFDGVVFSSPSTLARYLADPIRPELLRPAHACGAVVAAKLHAAMHTDAGLCYSRFARTLGISIEDACHRFPDVNRLFRAFSNDERVASDPVGMRFRSPAERASWFCGAEVQGG